VYLLHFVLFTGIGMHILFKAWGSKSLIFVYICDQRVAKDVEPTSNLSMQEMGQNEGTNGRIENVHGFSCQTQMPLLILVSLSIA
jgi:hypothetical protein